MMKIVFCDIDGVLNSEFGTKKTGIAGIEEDKLALLKSLLKRTGAELVITSKARFAKTIYEERLEIIRRYGIVITDDFQGGALTTRPKAIEVLAYLQNKCKGPFKALVLDDNDDGFSAYPLFDFVKINPQTGLTAEDVEKGVAILCASEN